MAKKKTEEEVVIEETPKEPEYKEIHETKLEDIVGEPKEEEKEIKTEVKEEEKEIEWDPKKFEEDMTAKMGKISEDSAKKVLETITKSKEPDKEEDTELISPWKKEDRPPKDYEEVSDWGIKKKEILDKRHDVEVQKQTDEQTEKTEEFNKQQIESFNKYTNEQLNDLMESGKFPKDDTEARKALFQTMLDVNIARDKEHKAPIYSIKEIFYEHYKKPEKKEVAGGDAPISTGKSAVTTDEKEVNYNDVHKKSFIDLLLGK